MKRCPQCHTEFDEPLLFCPTDHLPLEMSSQAISEQSGDNRRVLADVLKQESPLALRRALRIAWALCDALMDMPDAGRVAGGLDPQAIQIDERAANRLPRVSFPQSPSVSAPETSESVNPYTAPEAMPQGKNGATDVYGVGAIVYHLLTGEPPFTAVSEAALRIKQRLERPRSLRDLQPDIPSSLQEVILRALAKESADRQQSLDRFKHELEAALTQEDRSESPGAGTGDMASGSVAARPPVPESVEEIPPNISFARSDIDTLRSAPPSPSNPGERRAAPSRGVKDSPPRLAMRGGPPMPSSPPQAQSSSPPRAAAGPPLMMAPPAAAAPNTVKYCPKCQTEYPQALNFCNTDGTALKEKKQPIQAGQETSQPVPTQKEKSQPVQPKDEPSFYDLQTLDSRKHCTQCGTEYPQTKNFCRYDGTQLITLKTLPASDDAAPMESILIGQYRCFTRLGEGGMGIVYKAEHVHLRRLSAIKVLLPQTAMLPDAVQMFRREAQLASSINHPNSVMIYDYGEVDKSLFYLAMEFIAGASLAEIIKPGGVPRPMPLGRVLDILQQICDVLDAAHQSGIIHRDLKPHNVMVTMRPNGGDFIKVVDFGIARSLKPSGDYASLPGVIVGTPAYMSPEQARAASDLDARADIYSLGVMVYQMLGGMMPYPANDLSAWEQVHERALLRELPPSLNDLRADLRVPQAVNNTVMRALDPDRNRRFDSAGAFMHAFSQAARPAS